MKMKHFLEIILYFNMRSKKYFFSQANFQVGQTNSHHNSNLDIGPLGNMRVNIQVTQHLLLI